MSAREAHALHCAALHENLLALAAVCACLSMPSSLRAQQRFAEAPPTIAPTGPRFRFGIGGTLAVGAASRHYNTDAQEDVSVVAPGLALDLGVQINDKLAVYGHSILASCFFFSIGAIEGVVEYTPTPLISLGTGVGWTGMAVVSFLPTTSTGSGSWEGVSIPLIAALNFGGRGPRGGFRAFRLGLETAFAFSPDGEGSGMRASLNLGYVSM
ncbi:MAG: hypothetical protein R3A52_25980 [Polyangiales bacterium]